MGQKKRARMSLKKRNYFYGTLLALGLIACIPVPMTTLAPAEIVAESPYVITAPMDGVVEEILITPNSLVSEDTPLIRLVDTTYKNDYILAEQEQFVADAKLRQASLTSFIDNKAKREIAVAQAENPSKVILRIDVPLAVGESLENNARVRMFMDSDPLTPIDAELQSASFYAKATPNGKMAYEAFASLDISQSDDIPRIGTRGVAKIYGDTAPLGFWLLRRPITITRQFLGI